MHGTTRRGQYGTAIGGRLRALRLGRGLSQEAVAERLAVKQTYISRWELGTNMPSVEHMVKLADFYGTSLDHLVRGDAATQRAA